MNKKKLIFQLLLIAGISAFFISFNLIIFSLFTKPCLPAKELSPSEPKTISVEKYLPFDENSDIVRIDSSLEITENIPVLDGSEALYPIYSAVAYSIYPENSVSFSDGEFSEESSVQMKNTIRGFTAVVDGDTDIFLTAHPSESQMAYAKEKGVELELVPIGKEAFVFIVNKENIVSDLSTDEIRKIYSGEITNWSAVGGEFLPINPTKRLENSGSQSTMKAFMKGTEMKSNPLGFLGRSIGFSFRFYVEDVAENGGIKILSINGIYPDKENISNKSYPVVADFYAVYRKDNDNENVKKVIDFLLSDEGKKIIEETGYVPY
ncbi:MAG: substrate-binding domain-containing protein [Oscillospiraceae bacterium]|nr:substrate-binding domain-containing protein [Oscillospiraceae bacterium]